jgi:hypothetical protein
LLEITTCPTQPAGRSFPTVVESMANAIACQHMPPGACLRSFHPYIKLPDLERFNVF